MKAGKITEVQQKRSVLKYLPPQGIHVIQGAGIGQDYSAISLDGESQLVTAMATISCGEKETESFAFWKACNKLETSGVKPIAIMVNEMLPARGKEDRIKEMTKNLSALCVENHVEYLGGHTELLETLRSPVITVIVYGIRKPDIPELSIGRVEAGQSILMAGTAAIEATAMLTLDRWDELNARYAAGYLEGALELKKQLSLHSVVSALQLEDVTYMHDISTGGVFAALWELGEGAGCGLEVHLKEIPICQETIEVCEFFDVNPYMTFSGGSVLIVTTKAENVLNRLQQSGISARMIGQTTSQNDRIVLNDDDVRYLTPPKGDDLYKIYRN